MKSNVMAKTNSLLAGGAKGTARKGLVFNIHRNSKMYDSTYPQRSSNLSDGKPARVRDKFSKAVKSAFKKLKKPAGRALLRVKAHGSLFHEAITVFMRENRSLHEILKDPRYATHTRGAAHKQQRQENAMVWARDHGGISHIEYRKLNNSSRPTTNRDLQDLVKRKMLTPSGVHGTGALYVCTGSTTI